MRLAILLVPLALAACDVSVNDKGKEKDVHISLGGDDKNGAEKNKVSVDVPGFSANLNLPGLNLGANMDLDGVKLAPGTKVTGVDVEGKDGAAGDEDHGRVTLAFTNGDSPEKLLGYYRDQLSQNGFTLGGQSSDSSGKVSLTGSKDDDTFAVRLTPEGSGSKGLIVLSDKNG